MDISKTSHECSQKCIKMETDILAKDPEAFVILSDGVLSRSESMFAVPLMFGWKRQDYIYTTPCGIKYYKLSTMKLFLEKTGSKLSIDQFNFEPTFKCWSVKSSQSEVVDEDVCRSQENLKVRVVRDVEFVTMDPEFEYSAVRIPLKGVDMNLGLVSGCDCQGDCSHSLTCGCRKLTDEAAEGIPDDLRSGGYSYKVLKTIHVHGMYECNSKCSCSCRCQNRVTQEGIRAQLEVFWTGMKGWGLRCLHDLPKGFFVCLYSGEVMTDEESETLGQTRGDEYFVNLNLIEIVEQKLGYESDVDSDLLDLDADDESSYLYSISSQSQDSVEESTSGKRRNSAELKSSNKRLKRSQDDFVKVREHLIKQSKDNNSLDEDDGKQECYVIDAKRRGNIGRFLNHSCSPNCILQNVFSETHDPRFPVLAFFTWKPVKALEELTWNYMYDDNINLFDCNCGSEKCRRPNKKTQ